MNFQFLVVSVRLDKPPATFYTLMNQVFNEYLDQFMVDYLNDIVIFSFVWKNTEFNFN